MSAVVLLGIGKHKRLGVADERPLVLDFNVWTFSGLRLACVSRGIFLLRSADYLVPTTSR